MKDIKYLTEYINKGSDMVTFDIGYDSERTELKLYQTGRYILSNEAVWRIFRFDIH